MAYEIVFRKSALKQLRKLPKTVVGTLATLIDALTNDPRPANCRKLTGVADTYRVRSGDYRVLYTVNDSIVTVEIVKIGNRQDVYDA